MVLIAVEGLDGAGTTTLTMELCHKLTPEHSVCTTQEPYESAPSENGDFHEKVFGFLHDRGKHCREVIEPQLSQKDMVICDRYRDSTLAYQSHDFAESMGFGTKRPWEVAVQSLDSLHEPWVIEPDVTVYIEVPVETAMRRNDGDETYEELEEAKEVYDYLYHGSYHDHDTVIVDGTEDVETVVDEALWKLREYHSKYNSL